MKILKNMELQRIELTQDWGIESRPDLIDKIKFEHGSLYMQNLSEDAKTSLKECKKVTLCFDAIEEEVID